MKNAFKLSCVVVVLTGISNCVCAVARETGEEGLKILFCVKGKNVVTVQIGNESSEEIRKLHRSIQTIENENFQTRSPKGLEETSPFYVFRWVDNDGTEGMIVFNAKGAVTTNYLTLIRDPEVITRAAGVLLRLITEHNEQVK